MTDPVHTATKEIDRNRWTWVLGLVGLALPFIVTGCGWLEGKAVSPVSGAAMTAEALESEAIATMADMDAAIEEGRAALNAMISRRNAKAEQYNKAIVEADEETLERQEIASAVVGAITENPWVATALASFGGVSILGNLGQFMDRRRKDRLILKERAKGSQP